jgi:hypothetical protein
VERGALAEPLERVSELWPVVGARQRLGDQHPRIYVPNLVLVLVLKIDHVGLLVLFGHAESGGGGVSSW